MSLIVTMVALAIGLCVPPLAWDKPTALAWENRADMMASAGRRRLGSSFVAHPVSSIQWATFDGDEDNERPRSWRFVNSAQRAIALPMDWPSVFDAAMAMERVHSMPDEVVVDVVRGTHAGAMPAVATQASLERALAAALVGRPVLAREVEGPTGVCCTSPEPLVPTEGLRLGSMHRSRVGAELRMDPAVVSLSRSTMPLCWPKAFHFAKMLRHGGDAAFDKRLGAIPVCWDVVRGRWMAQHRHRVLGGLLAGVDLLVVMGNEHALADGTTWRLPSKTRLTLARHAADLLAISSRSHADLLAAHVAGASAAADAPSTEHAKLLRRAREALRKAPAECDLLGISADLRSVLWKAEQAKRRNVEARQPRSKASQAEGAATVEQTTATLAADAIASAERQPPSPASSIPSEMPSEGRSSGRDAIWASVMPSEGRSSGRGQATQQPADGLADPLVAGIDASERRATRPRGVDEVTAAAIAVGPPETGSAAASALSSAPSFAPLARAGIQTGRPVELLGGVFSLREEVRLPAGCSLTVRGPGTIIGDGHTMIRAGGARQLVEMSNVTLIHCGSATRPERRQLGGVIFALGKSRIVLDGCLITSHQGFGVWAVQRANVSLRNGCEIRGCGRSGIVSFGNARVSVRESNISHSALHGICARGASHIELADAAITNSGVRGVYVYHNVTLEMRRSSVVGTRDAQAAAVQVEALRPGDQCRLRMDDRCRVESNRGQGVVVKGNVAVEALGAAGDAVC